MAFGEETAQKTKAFRNMDIKKLLGHLEAKYGVKLPRTEKITIDYDLDAGDLYIRLRNTKVIEGEPMSDGETIIFYDKNGKIVALETAVNLSDFQLPENKEDTAVKLSAANLRAVEAICAIEKIDRSQLLEELIEEGLRERIIRLYEQGKISSGKGAEMLEISLWEFLQLLEERGVAINWDSESIRDYLIKSGHLKSIEEILSVLKTLKPNLTEKYGVETIGVFGSFTKGQQTPKSDIDVLVTFKKEAHPGLFEFMALEEFLTKKLGTKVDIGTKDSLKPHIGKHILKEVIMI